MRKLDGCLSPYMKCGSKSGMLKTSFIETITRVDKYFRLLFVDMKFHFFRNFTETYCFLVLSFISSLQLENQVKCQNMRVRD